MFASLYIHCVDVVFKESDSRSGDSGLGSVVAASNRGQVCSFHVHPVHSAE